MHLRRALLVLMTAAVLCLSGLASMAAASPAGVTAATPAELTAICEDLFAGVYETPSSEPLAVCQWDMALIDANASAWSRATGAGVTIGILDSGVDPTPPDLAPPQGKAPSGAVNSPGPVLWSRGKSLSYYIDAAGGYRQDALSTRASVRQPDGKIESRSGRTLLIFGGGEPDPYSRDRRGRMG